jgi:hypothetical protein
MIQINITIMKKLLKTVSLNSIFLLLFITSSAQQKVEQWDRFELSFKYHSPGNSFKDVNLSAKFSNNDTSFTVQGFYDGDDTFKIRFMPQNEGVWNYVTASNKSDLNKKKGSFECIKASGNNHGMVKVSNIYSFKYSDGKQYYPFGTTAYAWIHMGQELQEITLNSLKKSGFNKVRMCVFPKNFELVKEEPELYPFLIKSTSIDKDGKEVKVWDFDNFNPVFFRHLEKRVDDLNKLGIEADLIIFHPYDNGRWGFDRMTNDVNIRYIKYLTARLSSFRNVWWSMANEYNLIRSKSLSDWDLFIKTVAASDPYRHLCSIHGSTAAYYDYWRPELTHVSVQDEGPVMNPGGAAPIRNIYKKPVIFDEVGYEGNLTARWGRYSGEEMTYLIWNGIIGGTYVTHGETFMHKDDKDTIFWAKGGPLKGSSWQRIAFLRKVMEEGPGPLQPSDVSRDMKTSSAGAGYYIVYFGKEMSDSWIFNLPRSNARFGPPSPGKRYKVDIIDTWDMTIKTCPEVFEVSNQNDYRFYDKDLKKVRLPLKPYIALRITEIKNQ